MPNNVNIMQGNWLSQKEERERRYRREQCFNLLTEKIAQITKTQQEDVKKILKHERLRDIEGILKTHLRETNKHNTEWYNL